MKLTIPGMCFLISSVPLEFITDGQVTRFGPTDQRSNDSGQILVLTKLHEQRFNLQSNSTVRLFDAVNLPDSFRVPAIYDRTQDLQGRNILVMMLNGWGDMILIQPALRALYRKGSAAGIPPRITIGCNWIHNFPYLDVPYIHHVCPNIMTLQELCSFDIIANLIPANYQRSHQLSMREIYLQLMGIEGEYGGQDAPVLQADPRKVEKIKPILDDLRKNGKMLLCVNWRSRFPHKNAPAALFSKIVHALSHEYQAVLFKDEEDSRIMQKEIDEFGSPIINLSSLIRDYHDTTAALSLVDAFISVDTGIVHAAGALGIPGVALFGPFPPETHVADYPTVMAVRAPYQGKSCHGPCLETHRGCVEVDYTPDRISPCFQAIQVEEVIRALDEIVSRCHRVERYSSGRNRACGF